MWDVVPYEIDNVRIRYYGENSAIAYSYGVDAKIIENIDNIIT